MAQSVEPSEVFNLSANAGYGVLRTPNHKANDHPAEKKADMTNDEGYENDNFTHHAF